MAHSLKMKMSRAMTIENTDVEIEVRIDDKPHGVLKISRGSVDWKPAGKHGARKMTWAKFDELMRTEGTPPKPRARARRPTKASS